jgi:hypothetical protein
MYEPKPGFKTSEFLVIVVGALASVLVGGGILSPEESQEITNATAEVINAVTELVKVIAPVFGASIYAWSRTKVKLGQ